MSLSPGDALRRASIRGALSGAPLGALAATGLHLASDETRGLLPFAVVGGVVFGAVIGWLAAVTAITVLVLGERRVGGRVLASLAAGAAAAVIGAVVWFAELGRSGGEDFMLPTTLIVVGVSLPLAFWQVRSLQKQAGRG